MTIDYYTKELLAGAHIREMSTYRLITEKKPRGIQVPVAIFNKLRPLLIENPKFRNYGYTTYTHKDQQADKGGECRPVVAGRTRPHPGGNG